MSSRVAAGVALVSENTQETYTNTRSNAKSQQHDTVNDAGEEADTEHE